jgi:N-acetylmuramic acid 6-phosphate etherase
MKTETVDPRYTEIVHFPTETIIEAMVESQLAAVAALKGQTPAIAAAVDAAAGRLRHGGRIVYAGAGTPGRIAVQDGVELTPTFGWPAERVVFLLAGGEACLMHALEGAEDDGQAAETAIAQRGIGAGDVLIGITASGRTPYVLSAIREAREAGALTIGITNNPRAPLLSASEYPILADTGSEIVAGSTRMKAGTAQKAVLNMISTGIMLKLELVHRGLMVNMQISNAKLIERGRNMVCALAQVDLETAETALRAAECDIPRAVLIARGLSAPAAARLLKQCSNSLEAALTSLSQQTGQSSG